MFLLHAFQGKKIKAFYTPTRFLSTGVEITIRQLAKCEWNLELVSILSNLLASLASVFSLLSVGLFSPLIESYSSSIPKYKHTPDTAIYLLS
jgi:hypothetical protein